MFWGVGPQGQWLRGSPNRRTGTGPGRRVRAHPSGHSPAKQDEATGARMTGKAGAVRRALGAVSARPGRGRQ